MAVGNCTPDMATPTSALPTVYYAIFAFYEPLLCWLGFLGAIADPKAVGDFQKTLRPELTWLRLRLQTHDMQAPWPADSPPTDVLPRATYVTIIQLGHVCALMGTLNTFVLSAARKHLASQPGLQEKIVASILTPLVVGDVTHLVTTFWALGENRWDWRNYEVTLWIVNVTGISLLVPRVCWHLGLGRYVHMRDGVKVERAVIPAKGKH
jgi:hypothetical protein